MADTEPRSIIDTAPPCDRHIDQRVEASFRYSVSFTEGLFALDNNLLAEVLAKPAARPHRLLVVVDGGVARTHPALCADVKKWAQQRPDLVDLVAEPEVVCGGEPAKLDPSLVDRVHRHIERLGLDRHAFVIAIGGGAVLDAIGYAASTAHRGVRLVRVPTTVLSQNDSGVGVKNGVNRFNKKNFLGTFAPPFAVINDRAFLTTLDRRDWLGGISEAVKVALIKDADFFGFIDARAEALRARQMGPMDQVIYRCAELHLEHIATCGDPFELGSSRPLDFGHWAAHKLESVSDYQIRHGEAVAIGICVDATYSHLCGRLDEGRWRRILEVFERLGLATFDPRLKTRLDEPDHPVCVLSGLEEFREHLGGELTVMLLEDIGRGVEVHAIDYELVRQSIALLETTSTLTFGDTP